MLQPRHWGSQSLAEQCKHGRCCIQNIVKSHCLSLCEHDLVFVSHMLPNVCLLADAWQYSPAIQNCRSAACQCTFELSNLSSPDHHWCGHKVFVSVWQSCLSVCQWWRPGFMQPKFACNEAPSQDCQRHSWATWLDGSMGHRGCHLDNFAVDFTRLVAGLVALLWFVAAFAEFCVTCHVFDTLWMSWIRHVTWTFFRTSLPKNAQHITSSNIAIITQTQP